MSDGGEDDLSRRTTGTSVGRLLAFSDGVFAIAFTILVLDLVVPDNLSPDALPGALSHLTPQLLSAVLSFAVIGRFWLAHHRLYDHIGAADHVLLVLNTILLAPIALIPFGAGLLADYGGVPIAVIVYAVVVGAVALMQLAVWLWAGRRQLIDGHLSEQQRLRTTFGLAGAAFAFLVSIPVAPLSPTAAELCWIIAVVPTDRLADSWLRRRRALA
jgi:uncharacterized membrane protein